eukprot:Cvel_10535.t3-p1 / transcript=Cvel_10535.t3 / gene=Cvel_10535 / organism=Chromera_velia_CCMP2878 / gene_product=hypothetical protein / transcript_product=hypothetical protein / location=Cvel_scaffold637:66419-67165(-) / protein_length=249 / sequence_SO=supercontig / SO=protein_coding / is_pseudo=false
MGGFKEFCRGVGRGKTPGLRLLSLSAGVCWYLPSTDRELVISVRNLPVEEGVLAVAEGVREGRLEMLEGFELELPKIHCGDSPGILSDGDIVCPTVSGETIGRLGRDLGGGRVRRLRELKLQWTEEGDGGVGGLAVGLGSGGLPSLERLSLAVDCRGGAGNGCEALGRALGSSADTLPSLRTLILSCDGDSTLSRLSAGLVEGCVPCRIKVDLCLNGQESGLGDGDREGFGLGDLLLSFVRGKSPGCVS